MGGKWQAFNVQRDTDVASGAQAGYGSAMNSIMNEFEMQLQALQAQPGIQGDLQAQPGTKRMQGTVTEWNPRGFGFVVTNDGSRAYVHNSQCGGEHLMEGEVILANIVSDPRTPG